MGGGVYVMGRHGDGEVCGNLAQQNRDGMLILGAEQSYVGGRGLCAEQGVAGLDDGDVVADTPAS